LGDYPCSMLTIIALVVAILFLSSPWNIVIVIVAATIDIAETDQVRFLGQRYPSRAPRNQIQIAIVAQSVHDPDKVILGNTEGIANLCGGHNSIGLRSQIQKNAKGIFCV